MDFPHLKDTNFPNLNNVNVYSYQNDFDYTRWVPNTKLKLVNVRWNGDYNDVVKFEDDIERDNYFDELDSNCSVILNTNVRMDNQQIKVPIPFDVATQYNYLVVDIPIATSADNMINYEKTDGFRRWYFFIQDWANSAPSTTVLSLTLDIWTQYINSVGFNYMMLERGHAPVAKSDTQKYLKNPIENSEYLLCPDVDFGGETISKSGKFIPFGNGEKYVCFASSCMSSQISSLGTVINTSSSDFTNPTFSNASNYPDSTNRWGYQYNVSGFNWTLGKDYSNVKTQSGNSITTDGRIPNNTTVYAVPASDANAFLNDVKNISPSFLKTILGCFMVAKELVTVKNTIRLANHNVYVLAGNENQLDTFNLTVDMFDYPEEYQRFAKLYTYPYAELEVTDNAGKSVNVRIESTGDIQARAITSVAFPYLNMRVFLTGISGVGSQNYKWTDLNGSHDESISNSDWYKFCFDFDIPTYALYMDGLTSWELENYNRTINYGKNSALVNYHNSVRQADNVYSNSVAESNTANTNATNSANTAKNNNIRSSNTAHTNTNNNANTLVSNNTNSCNANTAITNHNNANISANTSLHNTLISEQNNNKNSLSRVLTTAGNSVCAITTEVENNVTTATTGSNITTNIASSAASGAVTGGIAGSAAPGVGTAIGAAVGAIAGGAGALVAGVGSAVEASLVTQANSQVASLTQSYNTVKSNNTILTNSRDIGYQQTYNNGIANNNISCNSANCASQNDCSTANTNNNANTMKTNATNLDNANTTNATNAANTSIANADRTKNTTQNNSLYTRNAAVIAAQDILKNTQNNTKYNAYDARNNNPVQLCSTSGDSTADYMHNKGIQIKVRTQSKSAIKMTGDEFVRFGYALNQIWNVEETGLCLMKHFTYWKTRDCWVYDKCETNDMVQTAISALFNRGVTVWNNPSEVGRVNPYGN